VPAGLATTDTLVVLDVRHTKLVASCTCETKSAAQGIRDLCARRCESGAEHIPGPCLCQEALRVAGRVRAAFRQAQVVGEALREAQSQRGARGLKKLSIIT